MQQFEVLSKYLINDDNVGASECFDSIILSNLKDKNIFSKLDRIDKWFILTYLKSVSVSPSILIRAKDANNNDVTVDLPIVDILTKISEYTYKFDSNLGIKDVNIQFKKPTCIYSADILPDAISTVTLKDTTIEFHNLTNVDRKKFLSSLDSNLIELLNSFLALQDHQNTALLIENKQALKNIFDVKFSVFDNTLFAFLKSIYYPYAKSIYIKKYTMINKVGVSLSEIDRLTPFEIDIFLNILNSENKALAEKKEVI